MSVKTTRAPYKIAFNTRLDPDVYEALSKTAHDTNNTMTAIIDAALCKYLKIGKTDK